MLTHTTKHQEVSAIEQRIIAQHQPDVELWHCQIKSEWNKLIANRKKQKQKTGNNFRTNTDPQTCQTQTHCRNKVLVAFPCLPLTAVFVSVESFLCQVVNVSGCAGSSRRWRNAYKREEKMTLDSGFVTSGWHLFQPYGNNCINLEENRVWFFLPPFLFLTYLSDT